MSTTTEQQIRAIRQAIRAMHHDVLRIKREKEASVERTEVLGEIASEIQALEDAITALKATSEFRSQLKAFLG